MRTQNDSLISAPIIISGTWESEPVWVNQLFGFGFQLGFENASAICKLQTSNDKGNPQAQSPNSYNVNTWNDLLDSETTMTGDGIGDYNVSEVNYAWVRVSIIGDVDLNSIKFNGKGV